FSALAFGSVLTLVATGIYQSWRQLGSWSALTATGFGQLLLVKVGLVAVIVLIAASSRRWTGRLADAPAAPAAVPAPATATATSAPAAEPQPPAAASAISTTTSTAERTAQLARQQTARDTVRRRQLRDADPARSALRRSVLAEAAVAVV